LILEMSMHIHADFERMIASTVRLAIFDARQGNKKARRFLADAGLAQRAGILVIHPILEEAEQTEVSISEIIDSDYQDYVSPKLAESQHVPSSRLTEIV
jgi:hypothetical protein